MPNHGSIADVEKRIGVARNFIKRALFEGRRKKALGDVVGISPFGMNHTTVEPGAQPTHQLHRKW